MNQVIKYLNSSSTHNKSVFKEIMKDILQRFKSLISFDSSNWNAKVDELYSVYCPALVKIGLVKWGSFPILYKVEFLTTNK